MNRTKLNLILGINLGILLITGCFGNQSAKPAPVRLAKPPVTLTKFFPRNVGTKWTYEGFAEYRDTRSLLRIQKPKNKSSILEIMNFSGKVADLSDGESKRNFNFRLRYLFTINSVYEEIIQADTPFPHQIRSLQMLTLPLEKGATWQQQITQNKQSKKLQAQILELRTENGKQIVKVRYHVPMQGMPQGVYEEIREFTTGMGLTYFEKTFDENSENRFQYRLYELQQ